MLYGAQETSAVLEISPVIEETVKLIPLLFGLIVLNSNRRRGIILFLILQWDLLPLKISVTFWNTEQVICFYLLVRGFSTGAMHITCAFYNRVRT